MKKLLFLTVMLPCLLQAQTYSGFSATQSSTIRALILNPQTARDKVQDANFASLPVMDTAVMKVVSGKVVIPAIPLLQGQDKITSSAIAVLQSQNTSLQQQVNDLTAQVKFDRESAAMQITALQGQVLELQLQVARILAALQKPIL